jgi:hypothetical protein
MQLDGVRTAQRACACGARCASRTSSYFLSGCAHASPEARADDLLEIRKMIDEAAAKPAG